jgi:hypothetical protein
VERLEPHFRLREVAGESAVDDSTRVAFRYGLVLPLLKTRRDRFVDEHVWVINTLGSIDHSLCLCLDIELLGCDDEIPDAELLACNLLNTVVVSEQTVIWRDLNRPAELCLYAEQRLVVVSAVPNRLFDRLKT